MIIRCNNKLIQYNNKLVDYEVRNLVVLVEDPTESTGAFGFNTRNYNITSRYVSYQFDYKLSKTNDNDYSFSMGSVSDGTKFPPSITNYESVTNYLVNVCGYNNVNSKFTVTNPNVVIMEAGGRTYAYLPNTSNLIYNNIKFIWDTREWIAYEYINGEYIGYWDVTSDGTSHPRVEQFGFGSSEISNIQVYTKNHIALNGDSFFDVLNYN